MKKIIYAFGLVLCASLLFSSCDFGPKYDVEIESIITEITSDMGSVGISENLQKKAAFLVQMNPSENVLDCASDFISDKTLAGSLKMKNIPFSAKRFDLTSDSLHINNSRTVTSENSETVYSVGDSLNFYAQNEDNTVNSTLAADSICKAVGKHCYVWYKAKSGITISDSKLKSLADKFDGIYEKETYIFGSNIPEIEFDEIIDVSNETKINILVYDLFDDYETTKKTLAGTYGYFYQGDMFTNEFISSIDTSGDYISNEKELIHIDSYFLIEDEERIISTLAHEFQHMLNFVNKSVNNSGRIASSTWFDEMMSMVCEDIMQTQLGISNDGAPRSRMPTFNIGYYLGFTEWYDGDDIYYSYANAYAFGAFLLRNFGIDFIRELAQNPYVDKTAITKALVSKKRSLSSFDEVFGNYWNVILYPDATSGWTLNKAVEQTYSIKGSDVTFKCTAINLNDYTVKFNDGSSLTGPAVIIDGYNSGVTLGPCGMIVTYLGTGLQSFDVSEFTKADQNKKIFLVFN